MMTRPVNLSVHRNTRDQRRRHETAKDLVIAAKHRARHKNIARYVIITWDEDAATTTGWRCIGSGVHMFVLPEFCKTAIQRTINKDDAHDAIHGPPEDDTA